MSVSLAKAVMNIRFAPGETPLPQPARHVLHVLAAHCNEKRGDHSCYVSLATIAAETGANRTTVMRAIDTLLARSYILADRRHRVRTTYVLTNPKTWPQSGSGARPASGSGARPVAHRNHPAIWSLSPLDLVAQRDLSGRGARPQQGFKESEQEGGDQQTRDGDDRQAATATPLGNKLPSNTNHKPRPPRGWHTSEKGIEDAARLRGLKPGKTETYTELKKRVFDDVDAEVRLHESKR